MIKIGNDWYRCAGEHGLDVERKVGGVWKRTNRRAGDIADEWRAQVDDEFSRRGLKKPMGKFKYVIHEGHGKLGGWKLITPVQFVDQCIMEIKNEH